MTENQKQKQKKEFDCFISMPFCDNFDRIYDESLLNINRFLGDKYSVNIIRLDKEAYKRRRIEDNVLRNIDLSDLLIADISSYDGSSIPNVSVMHEIGYADGRGIPFVLIGKSGTYEKLPANLKGSLIVSYDYNKDQNLQGFSEKLGKQLKIIIEENLLQSIRGNYKVTCFDERPHQGLVHLIENATQRVYVLTTNLDYTNVYLKDAVNKALRKNEENPRFKVELLTMDPESDVTNARATQLGLPIREYRDGLRASIDSMRKDMSPYGSKVQIITYKTLPTQMAYIVDNIAITCVVSFGQQGRESVHFLLNNRTEPIEPFLAHFRAMKTLAMANVNIL